VIALQRLADGGEREHDRGPAGGPCARSGHGPPQRKHVERRPARFREGKAPAGHQCERYQPERRERRPPDATAGVLDVERTAEPPTNVDANHPVSPTTMDPRTAGTSPATVNPGSTHATSASEMPFTTRMNRPRVSTVSGKVRIRMIGRMTALTIPSSSAARSSV